LAPAYFSCQGGATSANKAYPRRSECLTWPAAHCAKGRATSGKQDVMRKAERQDSEKKI